MSKTNLKRRKILSVVASLLVVGLIICLGFVLYNRQQPRVTTASPVIHQLPSQQNSSGTKTPTTSNGINQGTSTNSSNPSTTPIVTNQNQWTTSASGLITIKQPLNNADVKPGFTLAGSSTVNNVQYTLIDNDVGVISQGALNVVNGDFSATINFQSHASSGRLDVYSTESNGREINEVEITVNF